MSNALESHIGLADELVILELRGGSAEADVARFDQVGAVDDIEDLADVLLDDEHGEPLGADAADEIKNLLDHERGEAGGRLVHEQELWARHEGTTDRAHLLLAAGERASELAAPLLETREEIEDPVQSLGEARPRRRDEGADAQVLLDREFRKQAAVLRH